MPTRKDEMIHRTRKWVFGSRLVVGLFAVCLSAFFIRPSFSTAGHERPWKLLGLALLLTGLFLRAWGAASAGRHTRSAHLEAETLATGGPYAYVRNPIYLGSMTLGLGMILLLGDPWMYLPYSATFGFLFFFIIPGEEEFLRLKFGSDYRNYAANVPRFLPRHLPWRGRKQVPLDPIAAVGEWRIISICAGILIFFFFVAKIRERISL
jgi:protein-S-isoprenylcysteine O-methyltransferase Ste14